MARSALELTDDSVVIAPPLPHRRACSALDRRSNCLARALLALGARSADHVVVLCCERHSEDRATAVTAARKVGATLVAMHPDDDMAPLRDATIGLRRRFVLACAEGGETWTGAGVRGMLISDVPNAYWWRLLENSESAEPL